jgi:hypothetical protein
VTNTVVETKKMIKTMSVEINKVNKILGRFGKAHLKATANAYGIKVSGKLEACKSFAISKAKQKKTNKVGTKSSNVSRGIHYVDISLIKVERFGGAKFWALIVDDCTDYCWSYFVKSKDHLNTKLVELVKYF